MFDIDMYIGIQTDLYIGMPTALLNVRDNAVSILSTCRLNDHWPSDWPTDWPTDWLRVQTYCIYMGLNDDSKWLANWLTQWPTEWLANWPDWPLTKWLSIRVIAMSMSTVCSRFTGGTKDSAYDSDTTINIFSLASGHLYERFLRYSAMQCCSASCFTLLLWNDLMKLRCYVEDVFVIVLFPVYFLVLLLLLQENCFSSTVIRKNSDHHKMFLF